MLHNGKSQNKTKVPKIKKVEDNNSKNKCLRQK